MGLTGLTKHPEAEHALDETLRNEATLGNSYRVVHLAAVRASRTLISCF